MVESLTGYIKSFINVKEDKCDIDFMGDIDEDENQRGV